MRIPITMIAKIIPILTKIPHERYVEPFGGGASILGGILLGGRGKMAKRAKDRPGDVWIFGKQIGGKEVYIKLKIAQGGQEKIAKCLSFHAAKYPLYFPFQDKPEEGREEK